MILCREDLAQRIDKAVFPFSQGGPLMHAVAAKAVALREAALPEFQSYARQVVKNSQALSAGLAGAGLRPVAGGTDTHLALADLRGTGVTGHEAEARCEQAKINVNKNAIPYDPEKPAVASGIRVGTPCVTTQGMRESEMREVAGLIAAAITADPATPSGATRLADLAAEAAALAARFPAYPEAGLPGAHALAVLPDTLTGAGR
jgi:glycine hydroxymethyltransferase